MNSQLEDRDRLFERLRAARCFIDQADGIRGRLGNRRWTKEAGQAFAFLSIVEPHIPLKKRLEIAAAIGDPK